MPNDWLEADPYLSTIKVISNSDNEPVTIEGNSDVLKCIGIGTDAAVFQYIHLPQYAYKLYSEERKEKIKQEAEIYHRLGTSSYFSTCYGYHKNYLVLQYEEGITLYDCLLRGIYIPKQVVQDVDNAREYARQKGMNPRDIHLRNILLQNGRAKVIDVSEYLNTGNDYRWEHLRKGGYDEYYHLIAGKSIPIFILESIRKWYSQRRIGENQIDDFMQNISKLINFWK